ncbi:MAG: hypothetical protein DRN30_04140, partial [Thermoplasmata archaeon]
KEDCAGRSQHKCGQCGKCLGIFEPCDCQDEVYQSNPIAMVPTALEKLYDELGTYKWVDKDAKWNHAIQAVRTHIKDQLV